MLLLKKRNPDVGDVKVGAVYQKAHQGSIVETATVLSVGADSFGIPHVRFQVRFERPNRMFLEDARVLALETFTENYSVEAGAAA